MGIRLVSLVNILCPEGVGASRESSRKRWNHLLIQHQIASRCALQAPDMPSPFQFAWFYRLFMFPLQNRAMNVIAAARTLNQKAAQQKWHHFCDPTLAFSDSLYLRFLSLWKAKAGKRAMPARAEMTPRDLKDFLRNIVVFQRDAANPSHYSWRIIGTGLTEVLGHNTGKRLEESVPPEHLPRWIECGDLVLDGSQPLRFLGRVHINGREYLDAEHLYVPLANDIGEPTYIMGLCRYTPRRSDSEESWESQIAAIPGALV